MLATTLHLRGGQSLASRLSLCGPNSGTLTPAPNQWSTHKAFSVPQTRWAGLPIPTAQPLLASLSGFASFRNCISHLREQDKEE